MKFLTSALSWVFRSGSAAAPAAAQSGLQTALKTTAGVAVGGTVAGAAGDVIFNDGNIVEGVATKLAGIGANAQTDASLEGSFNYFYKLVEMLGELFENVAGEGKASTLINWARRGQGKEEIAAGATDAEAADAAPTDVETEVASGLEDRSTAVGLTANAAGLAARGLGARAIPGVASVFAAATGIWETGEYLLEGDFKRAGTRFVSGAADTVLSAGGILSMAFATAAREGIEEGAEAVMGSDVDMPDSPTLQVAKMGYNWAMN